MKLPVVLAVLIGSLVLSCSSASPAPAEPTPNIDATVEARLAHERAVDATVEARLAEEKAAQPTATPYPTYTPVPKATPPSKRTDTPAPQRINTPEPAATSTPTSVPTATAAPAPTPTSTPTLKPTPTITYTPRVSSSFIALEDLNSNISEVPKIAWEDSQAILTENGVASQAAIELEIKVGPTTDLYFSDNEAALKTAIQFWAGFDRPSRYIALFYNFDDLGWAEEQLMNSELGLSQESAKRRVQATCTDTICSGANTGLGYGDFPSVGIGTFGIHEPDSWDKYRDGPIHIHEYTHAVQPAPWIGSSDRPQSGVNKNSPCWLTEGSANFPGVSAGNTTYEDYLDLRSQQVRARHYDWHPLTEQFSDYSTPKILEYYNDNTPPGCIRRSDYALGYSVGLLTVEALSAIAGSNSSMYLYKYMSYGKTFEEAFEIVYGSPWEEAKPILAAFVSSSIERSFNR